MRLIRLTLLLALMALPAWAETLHEAAARGDLIRVMQILDGGAKIDGLDGNDNTALMVAVERNQIEIVKYLIKRKASLKVGHPLAVAVRENNLAMARLLVESGANVNAGLNSPYSLPIEIAVVNGNLEMVKFLLEKKAKATIKTSYGTLLHNIALAPDLHSGQKGRLEIARLLVAYKVDPRARDVRQDLPFHSAVAMGHSALVEYFLSLGISPEDKGSLAYTPLLVASESGDLLTVKALLAHKASVKAVTPEGSTALHKAAWNGHLKVVEALLAAGASPKAKNKAGKTPLDLARDRGHKNVAALLKSKM
ncbi:MAG: hypothetical protein AMXMBFR33_10640 [Candidatus Xenobia bacterium]